MVSICYDAIYMVFVAKTANFSKYFKLFKNFTLHQHILQNSQKRKKAA